MGLHGALRARLQKIFPEAFKFGFPIIHTGGVVIDDVLTWLRCQRGSRPDGLFTGIELANRLHLKILDLFDKGALVYVCCCDIYEFMPNFKHAEQKKRDKSRQKDQNSLPYPDEAVIGDAGVAYPGGPDGYVPFDIHRVLSSRKVARETLMRYLDEHFRSLKSELPRGCTIIMDYSGDTGPVMARREYEGPLVTQGGYKTSLSTKPRVRRTFGEADHAMPFWLRAFAERENNIVYTIDTDFLLHGLSYITTSAREFKAQQAITWVYPKEDKETHKTQMVQVDMLLLARKFLANEFKLRRSPSVAWSPGTVNCTLMQFALMCAYTGTDFLSKSLLSDRVGADNVITWFLQHGELANKVRVPIGEMRKLSGRFALQLHPVGDCDPIYVCEIPKTWSFEDVSPVFFPPPVCGVVEAYLQGSSPVDPDLQTRLFAAIHKGLKNEEMKVPTIRVIGDVPRPIPYLWQVLQYFLVNWNELVMEDPVYRYELFEVYCVRGKHARDESGSQSASDRPLKFHRSQ